MGLRRYLGHALGSALDALKPLAPEQSASGHNQSPVTAHAAPGEFVNRQDTRLGTNCGPSAVRIFHVKGISHFERTLLPIIGANSCKILTSGRRFARTFQTP